MKIITLLLGSTIAMIILPSCASMHDGKLKDKHVEAMKEELNSVGVATMSADGAITLRLRSVESGGSIMEAVKTYKVDDPMYDEVRKHIGPISPGESKPIPPWPATPSQ